MRGTLKTFANAALIVVGFFAVFFAAAQVIGGYNQSDTTLAGDSPDIDTDDISVGVANADVPGGG